MRIAVVFLLAGLTAAAQAPVFDVASVKVSGAAQANDKAALEERIAVEPNALTMISVRLLNCIAWAYGVDEYQVFGPRWLESERYDIVARAAVPVPGEELLQMLQALLQERFKLEVHREERDLPVYALVPGKSGAKLETAQGDGKPALSIDGGSLVFHNYSLADWAKWASVGRAFGLDRPVVDNSGLTGRYNFNMKLADSAMDLKMSLRKGQQDPAMYNDALRAVGLKLELRKGPRPVVVIDHAEKVPSGN
ncbi:MAG: TIGR03435 family protein [Candidatus Sulfopaludibacter sp.]|nr:TIGR03435 family protein [Candidatus Sulfopaludibacter sp.]